MVEQFPTFDHNPLPHPAPCTRDGRTVVPPQDSTFDFSKIKARFIREGRVLAKLKHENIVSVLDIFEENKTSYLVMEYLDGDTLQSFLDDNTLIDYEKVRSVAIHLLKSLHEIHSKDVLHLDLKPSNIIVKPDNSPVLIDFGAARVVELGNINNLSISVGTEAYAAPEQFEHIVKPFDAYTDLYAFGAILYHIW